MSYQAELDHYFFLEAKLAILKKEYDQAVAEPAGQARLATINNDMEEVKRQLKDWRTAIRLARRKIRIRQLLKQWLQAMDPGTTATPADKTKAARTLVDELMNGIADAPEPPEQLLKDVEDALPPERKEEALQLLQVVHHIYIQT